MKLDTTENRVINRAHISACSLSGQTLFIEFTNGNKEGYIYNSAEKAKADFGKINDFIEAYEKKQ